MKEIATVIVTFYKTVVKVGLVFWVVTSYVVASMFYLIGEWWWTVFIFVAVWAMVITLVILNKQGKINLDVLNPKNVIAKIKTLKK